MPEFLTPEEVADMMRVTRRTVYNWLRAGQLESYQPTGRWLVPRSAVDDFLRRGHSPARMVERAPVNRNSFKSPEPLTKPVTNPVVAVPSPTQFRPGPSASAIRKNKRR